MKSISYKFLSRKFIFNFFIFLASLVFLLFLLKNPLNHSNPVGNFLHDSTKIFNYSMSFIGNFPSVLIKNLINVDISTQRNIAFLIGLVSILPLIASNYLYILNKYSFSKVELIQNFVLCTAIIIASGRIAFGLDQSLSSRYLIISFLFYLPYIKYLFVNFRFYLIAFIFFLALFSLFKIDHKYINDINRSQLEFKYEPNKYFSLIWNTWNENLRFTPRNTNGFIDMSNALEVKDPCYGHIDYVFKVDNGFYYEGWVYNFNKIINADYVPIIRNDLKKISLTAPFYSGFYAYSKNSFLIFDKGGQNCFLNSK